MLLLVLVVLSMPVVGKAGNEFPGESVLLLKTGRVIAGRVSPNSGGYIVRQEAGSIFVPEKEVRLQAADVRDAYHRLLKYFPNPLPETHLALAHWCLSQQLFDETKAELRAILKIEPNHAEARRMLRNLDELLSPPGQRVESNADRKVMSNDGFEKPPATSIAGLPGDTAVDFVTRVQPLLMNRCALGGCHASGSKTAFQLDRVRIGRGSSRVLTQRNLAAALRYIDKKNAVASPLLIAPRGNHGRDGRPVFVGSAGELQLKVLEDWVQEVTGQQIDDAKPSEVARDVPPADALRGGTPRSFTIHSDVGRTMPPLSESDDGNSRATGAAASIDNGSLGDPLLDEILKSEQRDAFDPAEFNRRSRIPR